MATMNYNSSSSSSNDATLQLIEQQAKENSWNSLPKEHREFFLQQTAATNLPSYNAATQASMVQQTPRFMPSASNAVQLSVSNYGLMDRTPSASSMGRSMSAASVDIHLQRSTTAHSNWHSASQDATSDYTFCSEAPARRHSNLESITEGAMFNADSLTEWSPDDYIKCIEQQTPSAFQSSLPIDPQQLCTQLTPSLQWSPNSTASTSPSTSSTALSTPVTHSSNPMSRQSSYNPHFLDSAAMLRIQSDSSCMLPILPEDEDFSFSCVDSKTISNVVDSSLFPSSFTGSSENFLSSTHSLPADAHAFVSSTQNDTSDLAEDMRRSTSTTSSISEGNASDASASSSASRHLRRDREIKAQASRKIAPKAIDSDEAEPSSSNAQMRRIRSEDGTSKTVGVITKTPYVRPQHPKIMCQYCDERPEGFRGTHELDRHIARAHAPSRKGYICVDYSSDRKFLANCKHCRNKKVYGAYYNAAAHLRRAHFHPRKRGRKGKNDEKRGGIGGGDDPPMDYLKMHWIREVEVDNKPTPPSPPNSASDEDAPEPDNTSYDATYELDTFSAQQPMPCSMSAQIPTDPSQYIDYGMSMHVGGPIMYDMPTVAVPFDNAMGDSTDMSNFHFDAVDAYLPH